MIWIILISIGVFLIIRFFYDREKIIHDVQSTGGMKERYGVIINHLLSAPESKIIKQTRDNIQIFANTGFIQHHFSILHSFNNVIIAWKANSPMGKFDDKWEFPHGFDQNQMADKISIDMDFKIKNFGDQDELMRRINKAMDDLEEQER